MPSYQTIKNSLKKLEAKQEDDDHRMFCGVITRENYDKLEPFTPPSGGVNRKVGYLVIPRRLTELEWAEKHGTLKTL